MNTLKRFGWTFLVAVLVPCWAGAQVPNELYMQGVFLKPGGMTNATGSTNVTVAMYTNSAAAALSRTTNLVLNSRGVANFVLADTNLPVFFQTCTNVTFHMTGGSTQAFVTAPYAFQAANLPAASGNFTIWGDLSVASNARLVALTATNGGLVAGPITVGLNAIFTNASPVTFGAGLDVVGGMTVGGAADVNYQARFTNTSASAVFYGGTNAVVLSNAVMRAPFTMVSSNYSALPASGKADCDGLLMVWVNVGHWKNDGVYVKIGDLTFLLRYYANAGNGESLHFYTGNTFTVPKDTSWSAALVDQGDSDDVTIQCYWVPLQGGG